MCLLAWNILIPKCKKKNIFDIIHLSFISRNCKPPINAFH